MKQHFWLRQLHLPHPSVKQTGGAHVIRYSKWRSDANRPVPEDVDVERALSVAAARLLLDDRLDEALLLGDLAVTLEQLLRISGLEACLLPVPGVQVLAGELPRLPGNLGGRFVACGLGVLAASALVVPSSSSSSVSFPSNCRLSISKLRADNSVLPGKRRKASTNESFASFGEPSFQRASAKRNQPFANKGLNWVTRRASVMQSRQSFKAAWQTALLFHKR